MCMFKDLRAYKDVFCHQQFSTDDELVFFVFYLYHAIEQKLKEKKNIYKRNGVFIRQNVCSWNEIVHKLWKITIIRLYNYNL